MNKKLIAFLSIIVLCALVFTLVACDNASVTANGSSVIFYVGDTEYARVAITEDFKLPADPTSAEGAFGGWYRDKDCTMPFDVKTVTSLTSDLSVYAKFVSATPTTPSDESATQGNQTNQGNEGNQGQQGGDQGGNEGQQGGNEGQQGGNEGQQGGNEQGGEIPGIEAEDRVRMQTAIDTYLEKWLMDNAEASGAVTDQKKALGKDLADKVVAFSFTDSNNETVNPAFNVSFEGGTYTVVVSWKGGAIQQTFTKAAKTADYANWSGKHCKPEADWLIDGKAIGTVDEIVAAFVKTVNTVSGNVTTGKFGISGTAGIEINGAGYGSQFKGNVDGTQRDGNEIGLAIVDTDGKAIGGLYYQAAAAAADSKLYLQYASRDEDGELIRDSLDNYTYNYKYIDYADLYGFIEKYLRKDEFGKTVGLITKFVDGREVALEPDSLAELLDDLGMGDATIFATAILNTVGKAYENDGRYYIDINIAHLLSLANDLFADLGADIAFFSELDIDPAKMTGFQGHITLSAAIGNDGLLTDLELAVNIPECTFNLNGKEGAAAHKVDIPQVSFAIYLEDFNFLTRGKVADVVPAEAIRRAEYFSPTNLDFSGDLYLSDDFFGLDDTFRIRLVTEINPFEVMMNRADSVSKVVLQVRKTAGRSFDPERSEDYLFLSYDNATKLFTVRGTAFELGDNGQTLYTFYLDDPDAESKLTAWLGLDAIEFDAASGTYSIDREKVNLSALVLFDNDLARDIYKDICEIRDSHGSDDGVPAAAGTSVKRVYDIIGEIRALVDDMTSSGKLSIDDGFSLNLNRADVERILKTIQDDFGIYDLSRIDVDSLMLQLDSEGYRDMLAFSRTTVDGGLVTFLIDASEENGFKIGLTIRLDGDSETRVFEFTRRDGVTTFSYLNYDRYSRVVRDFEATLSNVDVKWGSRNDETIASLMPTAEQVEASSELFPADGTGPMTAFLAGAIKWANTDEIKPYLEAVVHKLTDLTFYWFSGNETIVAKDSEALDNALVGFTA